MCNCSVSAALLTRNFPSAEFSIWAIAFHGINLIYSAYITADHSELLIQVPIIILIKFNRFSRELSFYMMNSNSFFPMSQKEKKKDTPIKVDHLDRRFKYIICGWFLKLGLFSSSLVFCSSVWCFSIFFLLSGVCFFAEKNLWRKISKWDVYTFRSLLFRSCSIVFFSIIICSTVPSVV